MNKQMREEFRSQTTPENLAAWDELERRGFSLCYHFGYENAASTLADMELWASWGLLYEFLRIRFGMTL